MRGAQIDQVQSGRRIELSPAGVDSIREDPNPRLPCVFGLDLAACAQDGRLEDFSTFILVSEAFQAVLWAWLPSQTGSRPHGILPSCIAVAALGCVIASLRSPWRRGALSTMAALVLLRIAAYFPAAPNHSYLGLYCLSTLAFTGLTTREERALALSGLGWLTLAVLFSSGFQKLANGLYFRGQFLAFEAHETPRMRGMIAWLLGAGDAHQLEAIGPRALGAGPFRLGGAAAFVASNLIWVGEMAFPIGLYHRRLRSWAVWPCLLFFVGIAAASRELAFGLFFLNLLALFARRNLNALLLPLASAAYGLMIATRLGWFPYWVFN
jgi:hypothetical protein